MRTKQSSGFKPYPEGVPEEPNPAVGQDRISCVAALQSDLYTHPIIDRLSVIPDERILPRREPNKRKYLDVEPVSLIYV